MLHYRDSRWTRTALIIFFILIACYAFYEAQGMLFGPKINITSQVSVVAEPFVTIRGKADHIATLAMNGKTISVTEDGIFEEPYVLSPGNNHIIFDAADRYGRKTKKTLEVVYTPSNSYMGDVLEALDPQATTTKR